MVVAAAGREISEADCELAIAVSPFKWQGVVVRSPIIQSELGGAIYTSVIPYGKLTLYNISDEVIVKSHLYITE